MSNSKYIRYISNKFEDYNTMLSNLTLVLDICDMVDLHLIRPKKDLKSKDKIYGYETYGYELNLYMPADYSYTKLKTLYSIIRTNGPDDITSDTVSRLINAITEYKFSRLSDTNEDICSDKAIGLNKDSSFYMPDDLKEPVYDDPINKPKYRSICDCDDSYKME